MAKTTTKPARKTKPIPSIVPTKKSEDPTAITMREYGGLQVAYDHLNKVLFSGKLPDAMITYTRKPHMNGHFSEDRYSARDGKFRKPEIALNPDSFIDRTDEQIVSTLAHEMKHLEQYRFGKPGSRGYHNKEWAASMKAIGLMPSNTGAVGGKETGQQMTHYIIPGGPYQQAFKALAATGWKLNLQSTVHAGGTKAPPSKVKFTCPSCGSNMWGKPESKDICGDCNQWRAVATAVADASYDQQAAE
jgi:predicted SprT family Zn-dependent metalloprotease